MLLTIDVGNTRIKVAVFEHNKQLDFFIFETDEALKNFKNIFKKYYRATSNNWNNSLGLGLFIVKSILNVHNFKLEIDSKIGNGSTFKIYY